MLVKAGAILHKYCFFLLISLSLWRNGIISSPLLASLIQAQL